MAFAPGAALVMLVFAYGWPRLTDSPQPRATSIMLAVLGGAGLSATVLAEAEPFLEWLPTLVGIGLLWAFVQNLSRGYGATPLFDAVGFELHAGERVGECVDAVGRREFTGGDEPRQRDAHRRATDAEGLPETHEVGAAKLGRLRAEQQAEGSGARAERTQVAHPGLGTRGLTHGPSITFHQRS